MNSPPASSLPLVVICGFLGSGKTTLLRRWRRLESLRDAAVIVQDLSELGVDAELLSDEGALPSIGELRGRVAALHGRHARGELHASMGGTLDRIADLDPPPPQVLVESTGAARPWPLLRAVTQHLGFHLRHFLVTIDALNLHRDFDDAALLGDPARLGDPDLREVASLMLEQAAFASVIILTKVDQVAKTSLRVMVDRLRELFPGKEVALSAKAGLLPEHLDGAPPPDLAELEAAAAGLPDTATMGDVESEVFRDARPFHPERLWACCREHMGTGLYRTKGFLWLASRPAEVLLWQQAGSRITLEFTGLWRAELVLNREGRLLPEEVAYLRERVAGLDPVFGDRHNELVLIGRDLPRGEFARRLRDCLCTEEEVARWRRGEGFPDPWPKTRLS